MKVMVEQTDFPGLLVVEVQCFTDGRGFFMETWNKRDFAAAGIEVTFVQESHSRSTRGVLRGLHYQDMKAPFAKLVRCTVGEIFDVAADLRIGSPTFGKWYGLTLSAENKKQLWIPVGFAHGFQTVSDVAEVQYRQTDYYLPGAEGAVLWSDPDLAISWPILKPILSEKDMQAQTFAQYQKRPVFRFEG